MHARVQSTAAARNPALKHWGHAEQRIHVRYGQRLHLFKQFLDQLIPIFQADFEYLAVLNLGYPNKVEMSMGEVFFVGQFFDELCETLVSVAKQRKGGK